MEAPRYCYRHPDRETGLSCSECGRPICYECMTPAPVGLRCPDHSGKPQGIQKVQRAVTGVGSRRVNAVTMTLIGINVAVFLAEFAAGGNVDGTGNWIFTHGALFASGAYLSGGGLGTVTAHQQIPAGFHMVGVAHGEWWRLLTAAFLHYGFFHIAINMYSLYFAGTLLEHVIGRWRFALLYLGSGIAGSAGALVLSPNEVTVGASGAIFGILGALFVLERNGRISSGGQILGLIVLNLVFTFAVSNISVGGHIGGLIAGIILMIALLHFRRSTALSIAATLAVVVVSVVIAYAQTRGYS
ncbi:MAG TPA: rhomboid family intramembrane serine protease [Gaiellaceae bacterium]|nr:rhomboid family intramembrane serine protease [Gaiellaceae bacterium]